MGSCLARPSAEVAVAAAGGDSGRTKSERQSQQRPKEGAHKAEQPQEAERASGSGSKRASSRKSARAPKAAMSVARWDYSECGPEQWAETWEAAAKGTRQSPIDLVVADAPLPAGPDADAEGDAAAPRLTLRDARAALLNNGLTIVANVTEGGTTVEIDGRVYDLLQFHFHSPSEHTFDGAQHDLELHLVHKARDGQGDGPALAVVGILFKLGEANAFLDGLFDRATTEAFDLPEPVTFEGLRLDGPAFTYAGSLTTPPCTEGVAWTVLRDLHTLSQDQLDAFRKQIPFDNYRPVQPLNGRLVHSCHCLATAE